MSTDLVKVSFLNGIATVIRMLAGLVSVKVVAAAIGPTGIALLGQLNSFSTIILGISNGGINAGITKYTAEHSNSPSKFNLFLGTALWITIALSVITGLVLIIFAGYFSETILQSRDFKLVFYAFGVTVTLYALNALLISVLNGFREFRKFVLANIIASITGLIFAVVLAKVYGTMGALIGAVTYQSVVFFITLAMVWRAPWFQWQRFSKIFSGTAAKKLGGYSIMAIVSAVIMPMSQIIIRDYISQHPLPGETGLVQAGLWESVNKISIMYLLVVTTSLSVYYLPRLTELKSNYALQKEIFQVYKLLIPFLLFSTVAIYFSRYILIHLLYTSEFLEMDKFFLYQLPGDIFKMAGWVLGYVMIARSMTKAYILFEFVSAGGQVLFSIWAINNFGSIGGSIGYSAGHLLYFLCMVVLFRKVLFNRTKE
ncbi:MAG: O-antigen translocase [Chitinophagaceae bacterium]|nr:O-antigen translocase [Chitinophagaceae bacterium]